ncbi:hypothetical protein DYB37_002977 [Aphanomyces astaci]|uniref:PSP1 C-terminal domain-containing protein n=1 Tax=Aphanomyces astaci TaxID=112090 RepID=A0A3R6XEZ1_APHAT|nr:hypothetical protein DYB35_000087 [Aphanomyces astaci]RHZ18135.1 hypothetical protein DYB37_002977 [Aphanomyces astaci]
MNVQTLLPISDEHLLSVHPDAASNQATHDIGDSHFHVKSRQEWNDFLSSSMLVLSLDDPSNDTSMALTEHVKPVPISTASPSRRVGSPLVLAMSPLASLPSAGDSSTSWATWQLSMPSDSNNDDELTAASSRNPQPISPLGVPLVHDNQSLSHQHRLRAKSFSTMQSHNSMQQNHSFVAPPPRLSSRRQPPDQPMEHLRSYSEDLDTHVYGSNQDTQAPPRGIRSYSIGSFPSPSLHPAAEPRQFRGASVTKSPLPRPLAPPRQQQPTQQQQPPLPLKASAYEWQPRATSVREEQPLSSFHATLPPMPLDLGVLDTTYEVQFKRCRKDCFAGICGYSVGDYVKVEGDRGEDVGRVLGTITNDSKDDLTHSSSGSVKRIMRLASDAECDLLRQQHKEEQEVLHVCRTKVRQRMLPMNVIDAEYQFDRHKLTFYFEAERRIDFRELVRDLFAIYKTRIWLQQVVPKQAATGDHHPHHH